MKVFMVLVLLAGVGFAEVPATAGDGSEWYSVTESGGVREGYFNPAPLSNEIDQNQPSGPAYMAAFAQGDLAQSFQQTHGNISGAGILLKAGTGTSDNVTIQLWNALPNAGGTMLAEASETGTQGQWVDVFWTAVEITPATTYYLVFTGNTTLGITGDLNNPYPYGWVFANPGYNPFTSYDYAFRTYYDTEVNLQRNTWAGLKVFFE
jgi:hypothetical protein